MADSQTVLITGGSSGIGYTISSHFADAGFHLLWASISEEELGSSKAKLQQAYPSCQIDTIAIDLSASGGSEALVDWVESNGWKVDVLINNAGIGTYGWVAEIDQEREIQMIQLNVLNLYKLSTLFLPKMIEQNAGTIINISSNSSFQPTPRLSTYGATKAFVTHFTRSTQEELMIRKSKVRMMCVCPAAIKDTPFRKTGQMDNVRTFEGLAATTAVEVGKDVWKAYQKGKSFVVSGWKMRILYFFSSLIPYRIQQCIVRRETQEIA